MNSFRQDPSVSYQPNKAPRSTWQQPNDEDDVPIIDVGQIKQRQIQLMEEQNRGLDILSQSISRQRELATQLGQEVEDQNG